MMKTKIGRIDLWGILNNKILKKQADIDIWMPEGNHCYVPMKLSKIEFFSVL